MMALSSQIIPAIGMMMKEASKFAARTLVARLDTTTAPETITKPSIVVKASTCANRIGEGVQPRKISRPSKYTVTPR